MCVSSPVEVVLDVLSEVHVEQDEVVKMAAAKCSTEKQGGGFTAPVPHATHGVVRE